MKIIFFLLLATFLFSDEFGDEFDDIEIVKVEQSTKKDKSLKIDNEINFKSSYNYAHGKPRNNKFNDFRGFSALDVALDTKIQYKISKNYKLKSNIKMHNDFIYQAKKDDYKTIPDGYENEININELYVQGKLSSNIDISLGRQIVPWGKADAIRVLDVLNNTDSRKIGLIDIKDLKLGRSMSKIDYYLDNWNVSTIVLHENRFSKTPQYGSDYAKPKPRKNKDIENQYGIALSILGNLKGKDIGFYYARQYMDNKNYYSNLIGLSYVQVINSFLFKTDIAYINDKDTDIVAGIEYSGFKDKTLLVEIASKQEFTHYYVRLTRELLNKSLRWSKSIYMIDSMETLIMRTNLDYDINDELSASLGFITYKGEEKLFKLIEDNDRVFWSLGYSF